jgi:hypothetical protein
VQTDTTAEVTYEAEHTMAELAAAAAEAAAEEKMAEMAAAAASHAAAEEKTAEAATHARVEKRAAAAAQAAVEEATPAPSEMTDFEELDERPWSSRELLSCCLAAGQLTDGPRMSCAVHGPGGASEGGRSAY